MKKLDMSKTSTLPADSNTSSCLIAVFTKQTCGVPEDGPTALPELQYFQCY
jgi:hypothetical protein